MSDPEPGSIRDDAQQRGGNLIYRHRFSTRLWHWINAITLLVMLMSGLMIFNAHPRLYWGQYGAHHDVPWLEIGSTEESGFLRVGGLSVDTTGFLGLRKIGNEGLQYRAFPSWATIPSSYDLALARRWHLTFAWLLTGAITLYAVWSLLNGHLRRDLMPRRAELKPRHIFEDIKRHATLNFPTGEAARNYNILQKVSYLGVLFFLIPLIILTGLTMSPAIVAELPWLLDLFGGRQSARSIHFIATLLFILFVIVHLAMVVLAGPFNEVRSMITGHFRLPKEKS